MSDASRSAPGSRRDIPGWPPYVARTDDEDEVFAVDFHPEPAVSRTAVVTWQPRRSTSREWERAGPSAAPREEPLHPYRDEPHGRDAQTRDESPRPASFEGEVLFAELDPAMRRAISQRPIIALTVNALGYHLFISHAARRILARLVLIGVGVLIALLWGDLTDIAKLLLDVFAH